jgi:hypothetical protein
MEQHACIAATLHIREAEGAAAPHGERPVFSSWEDGLVDGHFHFFPDLRMFFFEKKNQKTFISGARGKARAMAAIGGTAEK